MPRAADLMQQILAKVEELSPDVYESFDLEPVSDASEAKALGLPDDYFEVYSVVDGETQEFGLFGGQMLSHYDSIKQTYVGDEYPVEDDDETYERIDGDYELFVPMFAEPEVRQRLGLVKQRGEWYFGEFDLGPARRFDSLTQFLQCVAAKLEEYDADSESEDELSIDIANLSQKDCV